MGRNLLILRKETPHLSKPKGRMITEEKNNPTSFVKKSERSALLRNAALYETATVQGFKGVVAKLF